jgi:hypothetical protein
VVDDKVLLARAYAEIARLKLLLKERGASGGDDAIKGEAEREMAQLLAENSALKSEVGNDHHHHHHHHHHDQHVDDVGCSSSS